jgi:GNAT superfamily N-acetyltransferase
VYRIRPARAEDLPLLPDVERAASQRFAGHAVGQAFVGQATPDGVLREAHARGRLFVATTESGEPVGFAIASLVAAGAHLQEMSVHPDHGRRGIGAALVEAVCAWARGAGFEAVTLTTLPDVPWNAPFYRKLGFRVLEGAELGAPLRALLEEEARLGLGRERVAMRRSLDADAARARRREDAE